jgi:hypothetical protein
MQAASCKLQAASFKPVAQNVSCKLQAASCKLKAGRSKLQKVWFELQADHGVVHVCLADACVTYLTACYTRAVGAGRHRRNQRL